MELTGNPAGYGSPRLPKDSELVLKDLLSRVPAMVYRCKNDPNWTIEYVSQGIFLMSGYHPEEFLSGQIHYGQLIQPEDAESVWKSVQEALKNKRSYELEYRIKSKSGSELAVWEQGQGVFGPKGELLALEGLVIDVSDRQKLEASLRLSEKKFAMATEAAEVGIWEWDIQTDRVLGSPLLWQLFGHETAVEEAKAETHIFARVHPDDRELVKQGLEKAIAEKSVFKADFRVVWPNGDVHWLAGRGQIVATADGQPKKVVGINLDITSRMEHETTLLKAKEAAEAANLAKNLFLANMSHEIRTPLCAILGYSELLNSDHLSERERQDFARRIQKNSEHLKQLIDDVLEMSKLDAHKSTLEFSSVNILELLQETIAETKKAFPNKGHIPIQVVLQSPVPAVLETDPQRLRQIFANVLNNALKFTEHGEVICRLRLEGLPATLEIEVEDSGIGISPRDQNRIFHLFEQADISFKRQYGGTGLGLALAQKLAAALGGSFELKFSAVGKGSCFILRLPVGDPKELTLIPMGSLDSHLRWSGSRPQPTTGRLSGFKILLAEDFKDNAELIRLYLKMEGAEALVAENGEKALRDALERSNKIDLILMDVQMPKLSGYEATKQLRSAGFTKPIIALTAHASKDQEAVSLAAGCDSHLTKPIQRELLIQTILRSLTKAPRLMGNSQS